MGCWVPIGRGWDAVRFLLLDENSSRRTSRPFSALFALSQGQVKTYTRPCSATMADAWVQG